LSSATFATARVVAIREASDERRVLAAVYGDAEPFVPTSPYVIWIDLDSREVAEDDR
jgi:hypothetical protein